MVLMKTDRFLTDSANPAVRLTRGAKLTQRILLALATLFVAVSAQATVTTLSFQPTPADLNDLDHHSLYTWRINNINLTGQAVTSATLSFTNISNWDNNPNVLHLHLFDTAINSGVASFIDDPSSSTNSTDMTDDFINTRYHSNPNWLIKAGTSDTLLGNPTFTTTGVNYTLNFNASQLQALNAYITNGNDIAFGLDPDCHFFNDGVKFTMNLTPVPEMSSLCPIIGLIAAIGFTHLLRRRRSAQLLAIKISDR